MTVRVARATRRCVGAAGVAALAACATPQSNGGEDAVPRSVAVVKPSDACPVTGAWAPDGRAIAPPAVRCCVVPAYPPEMRAAGAEGEAVVRVGVDSAGVPDRGSLRVVRASSPALAAAVRASVPHLRFAPATAGEQRPVIVELPYSFTLGH